MSTKQKYYTDESAIQFMRKRYGQSLKTFFHTRLISVRYQLGYTQAAMAEILQMDERSYVDLDHGKTGCSALTFALFLVYCCPEPVNFLTELKIVFDSISDTAA